MIGAGPIGLGVALFAREAGASVTVIERNPERGAFAEKLGWTVLPSPEDQLGDAVFDATGNTQAMSESLYHVSTGGRLVYVGLTSDLVQLDDSEFHKREITLLASRNSAHQFPRIIRLLEAGTISVKEWVTHGLEMSEHARQFGTLSSRLDLFKALVVIEND